MLAVSALYVYPLKSARGIALREATLTDRGFMHDRRFMAVDDHGHMITQRTHPALARMLTALHTDTLALTFEGATLSVPLRPVEGTPRRVRVFRDHVDVWDLGDAPSAFLSRVLGETAHLVYMPDRARRQVDPAYAGEGDVVGFADGFPYLLTTEASLSELNQVLAQPVGMERFRPNIVVAAAAPWAEDHFGRLQIGSVPFSAAKPCSRFVIVNTDQATGAREKGVLETISRIHASDRKAIFGQNLLAHGAGTLRVGDPVRLLAPG